MCQICGYEPDRDHAETIVNGLCRTCHLQQAWRRQVQDVPHWAQKMLRDERAILLDTQATGLGERDVVIELALLSATEGTPLYDTLIRLNRPIPWEATSRHGLGMRICDQPLPLARSGPSCCPSSCAIRVVISYSAAFHRDRLEMDGAGLRVSTAAPRMALLDYPLRQRTTAKYVRVMPGASISWQTLYQPANNNTRMPADHPEH